MLVEDIIPLTVVRDIYNGKYSGGKYIAWNLEPQDIPDNIESKEFWKDIDVVYGVGDSLCTAAEDLKEKFS